MFGALTAAELLALEQELYREMTTVTAAVIATSHDLDAQLPLFDYHCELSALHSEISDAHLLRSAVEILAAGGIPAWEPPSVTA